MSFSSASRDGSPSKSDSVSALRSRAQSSARSPAMSSSQAGTLSVGMKRGAAAEPVSALMSAKENPMTRI